MKKRRLAGALVAFGTVIALCGSAAWATESPYEFTEWDMEVTVPEGDYYILTRNMDPESPSLTDVGLTVEQTNEILETSNLYLDAVYYDASYELSVGVLTGEDYEEIFDYSLLSKLQRAAAVAGAKKAMEGQNYTVVGDLSWYEGEEAVFIVLEVVPPGSDRWLYQYQTVYNGRMVTVNASSIYLEAPTDEIKEQTRLLAEGLHFTRKLPVPQSVLETYEEEGETSPALLNILKNALIGAVVGGCGYKVYEVLKRKKKEEKAPSASENETLTGGDEP